MSIVHNQNMSHHRTVAIIGLGYVGLPLAVAFANKEPVIAFDTNLTRIQDLRAGFDITYEVGSEVLQNPHLYFTNDPDALAKADFYIISVPTPVDQNKAPDLSCVLKATQIVGSYLKKGDIVVYESTVYPGATQTVCVPCLEQYSDLKCGQDFSVGYSPERINSGDKGHAFCDIVKVVAGWDQKTTQIITDVYTTVVKAGIYQAPSIQVAEAAKIVENIQRDLNIALMNELAMIFEKMDIDLYAVLQAAKSKWNFMPFTPGLVGGHCIGVDPYYMSYKAKEMGVDCDLILTARKINEGMSHYIGDQVIKKLKAASALDGACVAILGLTFKENSYDLRNSKVIDLINYLKPYNLNIILHDPMIAAADLPSEYQSHFKPWDEIIEVDAIILCVAHQYYCEIELSKYSEKLSMKGARLIADIKGCLKVNDQKIVETIELWRL